MVVSMLRLALRTTPVRVAFRRAISSSAFSQPASPSATGAWARRFGYSSALAGGVGFAVFQLTSVDCEGDNKHVAESSVLTPEFMRKCAYEAMGTGLIVLLGCGGVAASKYVSSGLTLGGASIMWGLSVSLAVYATRDVSGAHLNPAITAALAYHKPDAFAPSLAPYYIASQIVGGAAAGALNYAVFSRGIRAFEVKEGITRGSPVSTASFSGAFGMVPNPAVMKGPAAALPTEVLATSVLSYMVFNLTDAKSTVPPDAAPVLIGSTVAVLVSVFGPVTGAGMNPARDLGPRLITALVGWKGAALVSAPVYTVGPIIGAVLGGAVHGYLSQRPEKE